MMAGCLDPAHFIERARALKELGQMAGERSLPSYKISRGMRPDTYFVRVGIPLCARDKIKNKNRKLSSKPYAHVSTMRNARAGCGRLCLGYAAAADFKFNSRVLGFFQRRAQWLS